MNWVNRHSNWNETLVIVTSDHECGYLCGPGSAQAGQMLPIVNNGRGKVPGIEWNSTDHTNSLVPLYARGAGSILFYTFANEWDPQRGLYIDNTEIAKTLFRLVR